MHTELSTIPGTLTDPLHGIITFTHEKKKTQKYLLTFASKW